MRSCRSNIFTIKFAMKPVPETIDLLNAQLRLAATPVITFLKTGGAKQASIPTTEKARNGFVLELEAVLPYNELSTTLTAYLRGTRVEISEGLINKYILIDGCKLYSEEGQLVIEARFSGSFDGTIYFKGTPFYEPQGQTIRLQAMTYDLKTDSFLLKSLKWLFHKLILDQLKKYTVIDITVYQQKASKQITEFLNKEWATGIQATGAVTALEVTGIEARQEQLVVGMRCSGDLHLTIAAMQLKM